MIEHRPEAWPPEVANGIIQGKLWLMKNIRKVLQTDPAKSGTDSLLKSVLPKDLNVVYITNHNERLTTLSITAR